jgi:hypothetical protein
VTTPLCDASGCTNVAIRNCGGYTVCSAVLCVRHSMQLGTGFVCGVDGAPSPQHYALKPGAKTGGCLMAFLPALGPLLAAAGLVGHAIAR